MSLYLGKKIGLVRPSRLNGIPTRFPLLFPAALGDSPGGGDATFIRRRTMLLCIILTAIFPASQTALGGSRKFPNLTGTNGVTLELRLGGLGALAPDRPRKTPVLGPGVLWRWRANKIVAESNRGLIVWTRIGDRVARPLLLPNHLSYKRIAPLGFIRPKSFIGAAYFFARGKAGRGIIVDKFSPNRLRLIGSYQIRLPKMEAASGLQLACAKGQSWFATLPWQSSPADHIRIWHAIDGRAVNFKMPPVWQARNSIFCGRNGRDLGWVSSGHRVHLVADPESQSAAPRIRKLQIVGGPIQAGSLSPDGRNLLLLTGAHGALSALGSVTAIMAMPPGSQAVFRYPNPAAVTALPKFSSGGGLAAFSLFAPYQRSDLARTLVFITTVSRFDIVAQISIPGIEANSLSFSPGGKRLAVMASNSLYIFHIRFKRNLRVKPLRSEMSRVQMIRLPTLNANR